MNFGLSSRATIFPILALAAAGWWYAASLEWRGERLSGHILAHRTPSDSFARIPLTSEPQRTAANREMLARQPDYAKIDALLAESLDRRPLYAPYWLDRAEAALQSGDIQSAKQHLTRTTALWSTRAMLLWKAAMLYARTGDTDRTLDTLRDYLYLQPHDYPRTLAIASRLVPDPDELLRAVIPDTFPGSNPNSTTRDEVLVQIINWARRGKNQSLGIAAWNSLSDAKRRDKSVSGDYVEWMARLGNRDEAISGWQAYRGVRQLPGLENGGFEHDLLGGLGWRVINQDTVRLRRDNRVAYDGQYSLKLEFSGEDNINFYHLRQHLSVDPGTRYRFSYTWRGERITTRSGPYFLLRDSEGRRVARTEPKWGTWDWETGQVSFIAPEDSSFIELVLRRRSTDALDNRIEGTLWLDALSLVRVDETEARGQ